MNPDEDGVIVDACTLQNFSAVGRLDILERHFAHSARWTPAIKWEAGRLRVPSIDWIGTALPIGGDVATLLAVQLIRGGLGATKTDPATLHLGEAEAIHFIENYQPTWTFVSDGRLSTSRSDAGSTLSTPKPYWRTVTRKVRSAVPMHSSCSARWQQRDVACKFRRVIGMSARQATRARTLPYGRMSSVPKVVPPEGSRRENRIHSSTQNNRIWTGVGRLTDFYPTVQNYGSCMPVSRGMTTWSVHSGVPAINQRSR